jgi:YD repeat-containing protein
MYMNQLLFLLIIGVVVSCGGSDTHATQQARSNVTQGSTPSTVLSTGSTETDQPVPMCIQQMRQFRGSDRELDWVKQIKYNDAAQPVEETVFDETGSISWSAIYSYDQSSGELLRYTRYDNEGTYIWERIITYDAGSGLRLNEQKRLKNGTIQYTLSYDYDNQNRVIRETEFDSNQRETKRIDYSYDDRDRLIEERIFRLRGSDLVLEQRAIYTYDSNTTDYTGKMLYKDETRLEEIVTRTYDEEGNCILERHLDEGGALHQEITMEYDSHKNLTKKAITKMDGGIYLLLFFEYEYERCPH